MIDAAPDAKMTAYSLFLTANARLGAKLDEVLDSSSGLSLDVYEVLVALEAEPGEKLRLSDLALRVNLSRSGLTRRLDRLEKRGYITREPCPDDRRGAFAILTTEGQEAREKAAPAYQEAIRAHFGDRMTEGESKQLAALMNRIIDPLE